MTQRISGTVKHLITGSVVSSATVVLARHEGENAEPSDVMRTLTDSRGRFVFDNLQPGNYHLLTAYKQSDGVLTCITARRVDEPTTFEITKGKSIDKLDVRIYEGHTIYGTAYNNANGRPASGLTLRIHRPADAPDATTVTNEKGEYSFTGVFPHVPECGMGAIEIDTHGYVFRCPDPEVFDTATPVLLDTARLKIHQNLNVVPTITVSGKITDESGAPVPGAKIVPSQNWTLEPLELSATSDENGKYTLPIPIFTRCRVQAQAAGYAISHSETLVTENTNTTCDLVLKKGMLVAGTLVDHVGKSVAGATITAELVLNDPVSIASIKSDEDGAFKFENVPVGKISLKVSTGEMYHLAPVDVSVTPGANIEDLNITLDKPHFIGGRVICTNGHPQSGLRVSIYIAEKWIGTTTDEDGKYRFDGLAKGAYELSCCGMQRNVAMDTDDADFMMPHDKSKLEPGGKGVLIGDVVDAETSAPIPDFQVITTYRGPEPKLDPKTPGRFRISGLRDDGDFFTIQADGYLDEKLRIEGAGTAKKPLRRTFALGRGAVVTGRVVDSEEQAIEGARVYISDGVWEHEEAANLVTVSDAKGGFRIEGVPPGNHELVCEYRRPFTKTKQSFKASHGQTIDLKDIALDKFCAARGRVVRLPGNTPVAGMKVLINDRDDMDLSWETVTKDNGSFELTEVRPTFISIVLPDLHFSSYGGDDVDEPDEYVITIGNARLSGTVSYKGNTVPNIMVILRNRSVRGETYLTETDSNGGFVFAHIRPGKWAFEVNPWHQNGTSKHTSEITFEGDESIVRDIVLVKEDDNP